MTPVVARVDFNYGEAIPADRIPAVPDKEGYEGKWQYDGGVLTYGRDDEAEYKPVCHGFAGNRRRSYAGCFA